ncbi:MAG: DUF502 domain-containing protein [Planctomycetia bacterium]|nr:DUF502 domain-containing protein [Planctomycetia bacterium]
MKGIGRFVKATLVGGVLFVVPLVVALLLVREAVRLVAQVLQPIAKLFPTDKFAGVLVVDLLALAVLVAVCFLAGLVVATRPGRAVSGRLEHLILKRVPGFTLIKGIARAVVGLESDDAELAVAMIRFDDAWVLGYLIERNAGGLVTVFVPSAPTPAVGSIYFMEASRVQLLNIPVVSAVRCVMGLGVGSRDLLAAAAAREGPPPSGSHTAPA